MTDQSFKKANVRLQPSTDPANALFNGEGGSRDLEIELQNQMDYEQESNTHMGMESSMGGSV